MWLNNYCYSNFNKNTIIIMYMYTNKYNLYVYNNYFKPLNVFLGQHKI